MQPKFVDLEALFADLLEAERAARAHLLRGCAEDVAAIEGVLDRSARIARIRAAEMATAFGSDICYNLKSDAYDTAFRTIGASFSKAVVAEVTLRMRSRLRIYATNLFEAEKPIAYALAKVRNSSKSRYFPRRVPIKRLFFGPFRVPEPPDPLHINEWIDTIRASLFRQVVSRTERVIRQVLASGSQRLDDIKANIASHGERLSM